MELSVSSNRLHMLAPSLIRRASDPIGGASSCCMWDSPQVYAVQYLVLVVWLRDVSLPGAGA